MKPFRLAILALACATVLSGCAGRSVQHVSALPDVQKVGNLEGSYSMKFTAAGETRSKGCFSARQRNVPLSTPSPFGGGDAL